MSTVGDPPNEEELPVPGQDPDSPSPEFLAWVASMTPAERMEVLRRFYATWDPPPVPAPDTLAAQSPVDPSKE